MAGLVFLAVFALSTWIPSVYLMRTNPAALERRMRVGPSAETRTVQRIIITVVFISFLAMFVISAFDHRFGWSSVPASVSVIGRSGRDRTRPGEAGDHSK